MSKTELLAVEIKDIIWDSKEQNLILYYEDFDYLNAWNERHKKCKDRPSVFKEIRYDLSNPNQMFNILCKFRNLIISTGVENKDLYKEYKTYEKWFESIIGLKVNLNEYGYLA